MGVFNVYVYIYIYIHIYIYIRFYSNIYCISDLVRASRLNQNIWPVSFWPKEVPNNTTNFGTKTCQSSSVIACYEGCQGEIEVHMIHAGKNTSEHLWYTLKQTTCWNLYAAIRIPPTVHFSPPNNPTGVPGPIADTIRSPINPFPLVSVFICAYIYIHMTLCI